MLLSAAGAIIKIKTEQVIKNIDSGPPPTLLNESMSMSVCYWLSYLFKETDQETSH
jgi:hypothetical protein